jgi:hypothetical protein
MRLSQAIATGFSRELHEDGSVATPAEPSRGNTHAEQCALLKVGAAAVGCDVYCTMEPCSKRASSPIVRFLTASAIDQSCFIIVNSIVRLVFLRSEFLHSDLPYRDAAIASLRLNANVSTSGRWSQLISRSAKACESCRRPGSTSLGFQLVSSILKILKTHT